MARKSTQNVAVLTADIIRSSHYSPHTRRQVDRVLRTSFKEVVRKYPRAVHTNLGFRITAGDEFQGVFVDVPKTLEILTYLRASAATSGVKPMITFRASIGVGEISVSGKQSSYEEDGPAFVRSRRGLEELSRRRQRWTKIITEKPELDRTVDIILLLLDRQQRTWTVPQWEAIKWSLLGLTRERIAGKLNVAHQSVTKRLTAASWQQFEKAAEFLNQLLKELAAP